MPLWRIRILVPDTMAGRSAVKEAVAAQPVSFFRMVPEGDTPTAASEVVVEIPEHDDITGVLSALHAISPQVFVSRVDEPEPTAEELAVELDELTGAADPGDGGLVPEPMPRTGA
jgi:hypothetical protein